MRSPWMRCVGNPHLMTPCMYPYSAQTFVTGKGTCGPRLKTCAVV